MFDSTRLLAPLCDRPRWQDWVVSLLREPLAKKILQVVKESDGVLPLSELSGRIGAEAGGSPDDRGQSDRLSCAVRGLAARDLGTIGRLPAGVRENMKQAGQPRERPPLLACENPREVARTVACSSATCEPFFWRSLSGPPRLRSDYGLYQRQNERFLTILEPLPDVAARCPGLVRRRATAAGCTWASVLQLVKHVRGKADQTPPEPRKDTGGSQAALKNSTQRFRFLDGSFGSRWALRPHRLSTIRSGY